MDQITGKVVSISIKGKGPNSAQLLFTVESKKPAKKVSMVVTAPPDYEPQVFTSMANFVTAAYFSDLRIRADYELHIDQTARAIEVYAAAGL